MDTSGKRYKADFPSAAAKKVANRAARDHGLGIYYVNVRETSTTNEHRYKIRVLRATKKMKEKAQESDLAFVPQRFARVERTYN